MRQNQFLPNFWSGRRVSNSRPQPWQGCALPTELLPQLEFFFTDCLGGARRNRTAVNGFAIRCITTLLSRHPSRLLKALGAGDESRTRDLNLGKVALYQLSYSRTAKNAHCTRPSRHVKPLGRRICLYLRFFMACFYAQSISQNMYPFDSFYFFKRH